MHPLSQSPMVNDSALSAPPIPQRNQEPATALNLDGADNLPSRDSFASFPPEDANGRHPSCLEASSSNIPETRDGADPCPERKSNQKQNNEPGVLVGTGAGLFLDAPCASDQIAHMDGSIHVRPSSAHAAAAGGGYPISSSRPSRSSVNSENLRAHQLLEGIRRLPIIIRASELRAGGRAWESIARLLGIPSTTLSRWLDSAVKILSLRLGRRVTADDLPSETHNLQSSDCAPQNHKSGRPRKYKPFTHEQAARIKSVALPINRAWNDTSIPEAIRRSLAAGALPPDLADVIRARAAAGLPLLTDAQRDQVALTEMEVRAYRSPNEANLDYVQSPGSLMLTRDPVTGAERFWLPGEAFTIDDGSINFGCCVPLERPGDKCWEKFGVIVGRFQFIPTVDHRTRAILGFSYTARPRDSYRAEDLTAAMHTVFAEHGLPRVMFLEFGTSNSKLVNETLARAGVEARHVHSPHEKVVEKAFDIMWTKLSGMPNLGPSGKHQVGRFRGEMEEENCLLTACKQGHKDPRKYFPSLPEVLKALRQAIAESNAQRMSSQQYGHWIPGEWFARAAGQHTRRLAPADAWMFSPVVKGPLLIRAACVGTSVSMMPGCSLKFHFEADFFPDYFGEEVLLHFNPFAPECAAMVVHARTGKVLGPAQQINRHARFTRRAFGYGEDPDIGHIAARKHAQALYRATVAIKVGSPAGAPARSESAASLIASATAEHRDGLGNGTLVELGSRKAGPPALTTGSARVSPDSSSRSSVETKSADRFAKFAASSDSTRRQAQALRALAEEEDDL